MRVYAARVQEIEAGDIGRLCSLLDQDRRSKVLLFKDKMELHRSVFAGLLLRHAFLQSGYSAGEWQRARILKGAYGKPYIDGYPWFHYSLSHSGRWVLCASDTRPVGADIQEMRPFKLQVAKRFYSQDEYDRLLALGASGQPEGFYKMWTAKESAVKLSGRGIGAGLSQYVTAGDHSSIYDASQGRQMAVRLYDALEGYIACVCGGTGTFPEGLELIDVMEGERC